jgi:transposase
MAKPYSYDLRSRVAEAVVGGRTVREVAELFGISPASAAKWSKRLRTTGTAASKPMGGTRRAVLADKREWLLARIKDVPDLTLRGLQAELAGQGMSVSHWAVWKLLATEKITFKKKPSAVRAEPRRRRPAA